MPRLSEDQRNQAIGMLRAGSMVEKEITTLMDNSLKYLNQPMYQFRAASVNHRLASLFHNTLRGDAHLEYIAMLESSLTGQTNTKRQKVLSQIRVCFSGCKDSIKGMSVQLIKSESRSILVEGKTILDIVESRLQFTLQ